MMVKDRYIHKFYAFALAAVFAIALAGCGGGGGTAQMPDPEPPVVEPEPTAQEMCEGDGGRYNADGSCTSAEDLAAEMAEAAALKAAQDAAMAAYTAAMAAVYGAKDPVARENAQVHATTAGIANIAAQAATTPETAMTHRMAAEAASEMAVKAGMTRSLGITKLANAAANKSAIDSAELTGVPVPAPISNAGRVGTAMGSAASTLAASGDSGAGVTGNTNSQGAGAVVVTSSHTATAVRSTVSVTPTGGSAISLLRGESPTGITMSGEKPGGGWPGVELVASVSGATGYKSNAIVFTDINPPKQSFDTTNVISATDLVTAAGTDLAVVTGDIPGDGSTFEATYNAVHNDNEPARSGRFSCPSTATNGCSISVDASGVLRSIQGYEFQPLLPRSLDRADTDYLSWGIWLHVPNVVPGPDVTTSAATVVAFASGSDPFQVQDDLTGSATYTGVANGLYAAGGMVEYFKADASLTANFGGSSANDSTPATAANDGLLFGAVTGSITNIKAGGMDVDGSISLGRAPVLSADGTAAATRFTGSTEGTLGGRALSGSWTGQFYGPNRASGLAIRTEFPTTAAGTFGAATPSRTGPAIRVLGSFGTWKAE